MKLKGEFLSSFLSYVDPEGLDVRRRILEQMLSTPVEQVVHLITEHDFAALLTCAACVDDRQISVRRFIASFRQWHEERQQAEDDFEDPDQVEFDCKIDDIQVSFDKSVPGLEDFIAGVQTVQGGRAFWGKVLMCLIWAPKMPNIFINLWSPK